MNDQEPSGRTQLILLCALGALIVGAAAWIVVIHLAVDVV